MLAGRLTAAVEFGTNHRLAARHDGFFWFLSYCAAATRCYIGNNKRFVTYVFQTPGYFRDLALLYFTKVLVRGIDPLHSRVIGGIAYGIHRLRMFYRIIFAVVTRGIGGAAGCQHTCGEGQYKKILHRLLLSTANVTQAV